MNEKQVRSAIAANSNRNFRRVKLNHKPHDHSKPHLAKHGLKGASHANRHTS